MADHMRHPLGKDLHQARPFEGIIDPRIKRIDVARQTALAPHVVINILISREDVIRCHPQTLGNPLEELPGLLGSNAVILTFIGIQRRIVPDRLAVLAPEAVQGPARQLLAGIPLALTKVHQAIGRIFIAQFVEQVCRQQTLGWPQRSGVPFCAIGIVDRNEGRLPTLRQAHIHAQQFIVNLMTEALDFDPLFVGIGLGDTRRFPDPGDLHAMLKLSLTLVKSACYRRGGCGLRRAGQRNMPLASKQARRWIKTNPAGPRQIHFRPGVQIGEIRLRTRRTIQRLHICGQLDQIAGNETRSQTEMAKNLHQQPGRIAAGAGLFGQRFFGSLYPRFKADRIADIALHLCIERHQKIHAAHFFA